MAVVFESLNKKSMIQSFLKEHWSVIAWFLVAITVLSVVAYVLNFNLNHKPYEKYILSDEAADWGTFGDYIGGFVGTIFTIIAALFVWLTYESQKEQLRLSKETAEQQDKTLKQQQFETTFFHMVSELRKMVDSVSGRTFVMRELTGTMFDNLPLPYRQSAIDETASPMEEHQIQKEGYNFLGILIELL